MRVIKTGSSCTLVPTIEGKKSELYEELLNRVGRANRKTANFLYSISKTQEMRNNFNSEDFNTQGEIKPEKFMKEINIDSFVNEIKRIDNLRKDVGAIDEKGNQILYNTPDEIYNKVIDYNNTHLRSKANIIYLNGKFAIDLDILGASNYNINSYLETKKVSFDALNDYLHSLGFSTDYQGNMKSNIANFLNVSRFISDIKEIKTISIGKHAWNEAQTSIILEMMKDDPLVKRLTNKFGNDLNSVLSYVSGRKLVQLTDESKSDLNPYWTDRINDLIEKVRDNFTKINTGEITNRISDAVSSIPDGDVSYFNISGDKIKDVLTDLYKTFHLDKKLSSVNAENVKSLSEAVEVFQNKLAKEMEISKRLGHGNANQVLFNKLRSDINKGKYAEGISKMMIYLQKKIEALEGYSSKMDKEFQSHPDVLQAINKLSGSLMKLLDFTNSYSDIVEKLTHAENLLNNEADLPQEFVNSISTTAKSVQQILMQANSYARGKQFDCVYAFLKRYWGDSDTKYYGGKEYSLSDMLRVASKDISFFDRFIFSMNETNDPVLNLVYEAVKDRNRARDEKLRKVEYIIRTLNADLYSESNTDFMFKRDKDNKTTGKLISEFNWDKLITERDNLKKYLMENGADEKAATKQAALWANDKIVDAPPSMNPVFFEYVAKFAHLIYGENEDPANYVVSLKVPNPKEYGSNEIDNLTQKQKNYYYKMLALKSVLQGALPGIKTEFFNAPQITATVAERMDEGDMDSAVKTVKEEFLDKFRHSAEDYGSEFDEMLAGNEIRQVVSDMNGEELMTLPILYTHKLKDMSRLSTDFSKGMLATAATTVQYDEMNSILDSMMLTKDWLMSKRPTMKTEGGKSMMDIFQWGKQMFMNSVYTEGRNTRSGALMADFFEKSMFGRGRKKESMSIGGVDIPVDKIADFLTEYTSITGLSTNLLGAEDNVWVGKMQMLIEAGAGEFFNLKDLAVADLQYFRLLPQLLNELKGNTKSSMLALLMDRFNVLEDYYESYKETNFYKSGIGKIIGKGDLMFMYGAGEHMLHAVPMLAILRNTKVHDTRTNTDVPLFNVFSVEKNDTGNGLLKVDYDRYQMIDKNDDGSTSYRKLTDEDLKNVDKEITFVNKGMNGAFNSIDKGMIHRYAIGRLIMNFRQWMPAYYEKRFNGVDYDADKGEFREGFYYSTFKFLGDCVKDLFHAKPQIAQRWDELSTTERYNLKRTIGELSLFTVLAVSNLSLGSYKDKRGNWAYRHLIYMTQRLLMETQASTPFFIPFTQYGPTGFIKNVITTLNSPMAAINTMNSLANIIDFTKLAQTVQSGDEKGQNMYLHRLERAVPFYSSIKKQIDLGDEDFMFNVFKQNQ